MPHVWIVFLVALVFATTPVDFTVPTLSSPKQTIKIQTSISHAQKGGRVQSAVTTGSAAVTRGAGTAASAIGSSLRTAAWITTWIVLIAIASKTFGVWILSGTAYAFNMAIDMTVGQFGTIPGTGISLINTMTPIWEAFRDLGNIILLFIFIFIAFMTILGNHTYNIKNLAGKVILIALLLNFSLFFTKATIDLGNFFGYQFYKSIQTVAVQGVSGIPEVSKEKAAICQQLAASLNDKNVTAGNVADYLGNKTQYIPFVGGLINSLYNDATTPEAEKKAKAYEQACGDTLQKANVAGIAGSILDALSLTALYSNEESVANAATAGAVTGVVEYMVRYIIAFFAFIGVALLFLYAAVLLVIRMVVLIFVMLISPIAFVLAIIPKYDKYFTDWKQALLSQAAFAPILVILLWAVIQIIRIIPTNTFQNGVLTQGGWGTFGLFLLNYAIVFTFLFGAIYIAKYISNKVQGDTLSSAFTGAFGRFAGTLAGTPFRTLAGTRREIAMRAAGGAYEKQNSALKSLEANPTATRAQIEAQKKAVEAAKKRLDATGDFRAGKLAQVLQKAGVNMGEATKEKMGETLKKQADADSKYAKDRAVAIGESIKQGMTAEETQARAEAANDLANKQKALDERSATFEKAVREAPAAGGGTGADLTAAVKKLAQDQSSADASRKSLIDQEQAARRSGKEEQAVLLKQQVDAKGQEIKNITEAYNTAQKAMSDHIKAVADAQDPSVMKDIRDSIETVASAATAQRRLQPQNREEQQVRDNKLKTMQADAIRSVFEREGLTKHLKKGIELGQLDEKGRSRLENQELTTRARQAQIDRANRPPTPPPADKPAT